MKSLLSFQKRYKINIVSGSRDSAGAERNATASQRSCYLKLIYLVASNILILNIVKYAEYRILHFKILNTANDSEKNYMYKIKISFFIIYPKLYLFDRKNVKQAKLSSTIDISIQCLHFFMQKFTNFTLFTLLLYYFHFTNLQCLHFFMQKLRANV